MDSNTPAQICAAFGFQSNTLRKWLNQEEPLRTDTGAERSGGWRRFTFADAVRFRLLERLIVDFEIETPVAISLVNQLFDAIGAWATHARSTAEDLGSWGLTDPRWIVLSDLRPGSVQHRIRFLPSRGALLDELDQGPDAVLVINLTELVRATVIALTRLGVADVKGEE